MNVTRHGGVFYRQDFPTSDQNDTHPGVHLSSIDLSASVRTVRSTDVIMSVSASRGGACSLQSVAVGDNVLLAWDGRLDNRSQIKKESKLDFDSVSDDDAVLLAKAYLARGHEL